MRLDRDVIEQQEDTVPLSLSLTHTHVRRDGVASARAVNCSRLHCLLLAKDAGSLVLGSAHFAQQTRQRHLDHVVHVRGQGGPPTLPRAAPLPAPLSVVDSVLIVTKLEECVRASRLCAVSVREE